MLLFPDIVAYSMFSILIGQKVWLCFLTLETWHVYSNSMATQGEATTNVYVDVSIKQSRGVLLQSVGFPPCESLQDSELQ